MFLVVVVSAWCVVSWSLGVSSFLVVSRWSSVLLVVLVVGVRARQG